MHLVKKAFFLCLSIAVTLSPQAATHLDVTPVGHWPEAGQNQNFGGMAVRGNYMFIMGTGLQTLDISNPAAPVSVASAGTGGWDVKLSGNYAFCATEQGLQVVDISNPLAPRLVTHLVTGHVGEHVVLDSTTATIYLRGSGADIFNISNPESPSLTRSDATASWPGIWAVSNGYYFTDHQVFDGASRTGLVANVPDIDTGSYTVRGVAVSWPYLYTAVNGVGANAGVHISRIREALQPMRLNSAGSGAAHRLELAGDYLFYLEAWRFGALDIHSPAAPVGLGYYVPYTTKITYQSLLISGNYAYCDFMLPTAPDFGLFIFDISNPAQPALVGQNSPIPGVGGEILAQINGYLYLSGGTIFDVRDPHNPTLVTAPKLTDIDWNARAAGQPYLQVSDRLVVYGLNTAGGPQFLKPGGRIALSGNYAFTTVSYVGFGVSVVDLLNGGAEVSRFADSRHVDDITINGHHAYIASEPDGVEVFDISVPTNAVRVGGISSFSAYTVRSRGDIVYAAGTDLAVLHRFDFPDVVLKTASSSGSAPAIQVFGPPGLTGRVQKTSSFSSWSDLSYVTLTTDAIEITPQAGAGNFQFFQFVSP